MDFLSQFNYNNFEIRVVGTPDNPWWVAADICLILDIKNVSMALARLDEDEKGISSIDTLGGDQSVAIVNESGLYSLILGSRKPEAKPFKKWITSEVIPSIRKTGEYSINQIRPNTDTAHIQLALDAITAKLEQMEADRQLTTLYLRGKLENTEAKLDETQQVLHSLDEAAEQHPGCADVLYNPDTDLFTCSEYIQIIGLDSRHLGALRKRASHAQLNGTGVKPTLKRNGQLLIQRCYLRKAARTLLNL